mmetsp:Transcript_819/g.1001  ORF Transcript_819/g.1001 Transcript_819/m.1001 type:complete len:189 (-) Transcript_819:218-784(-)
MKKQFAFYYAAVSVESGLAVRMNLGQRPFKYFVDSDKRIKPLIYAAKDLDVSSEYSSQTSVSAASVSDTNEIASLNKNCTEKEKIDEVDVQNEKNGAIKATNLADETEDSKPVLEAPHPIDLDTIQSEDDLKPLGLERLKYALQQRGLKCGGTIEERASRLFSVKGRKREEYDPNILAGSKRKNKRKR